jgi:mannose/fructose/N-acetylgalactosamine-specific phosphotransferase system component IID
MTEASALMAIALIIFMAGMLIIRGDFNTAFGTGSILAAMLLFPAFLLWALFSYVAREAKLVTRFLVALAVTIAIAAGAAYLMPLGGEPGQDQTVLIQELAKILGAFVISGLVASTLVYGLLMKPRAGDDATLVTSPVVPNSKKKKRK